MSYIRCLSNPEGLYIWGQQASRGGGITVAISQGGDKPLLYIPRYIFHKILEKYLQGFENIKYRGACLKEIKVYSKSQRKVKELKEIVRNGTVINSQEILKQMLKSAPTEYKWELSYNGWSVRMWKVTLHYIAQNVI